MIKFSENYIQRYTSWADWKVQYAALNSFFHGHDLDINGIHTVFFYNTPEVVYTTFFDGEVPYPACESYSQEQNDSDKVDYLSNWAAAANGKTERQTTEGMSIQATTFEYTNELNPNWSGHKYTAIAGVQNIFDEVIVHELQLRGGWYEIISGIPLEDDYIEFAIVDKDDVLGYFQYYGMTVGVDVLELKKYVKKDFVNPNSHARQVFQVGGSFTVFAGLYFRTIYVSTGVENVHFKAVIFSYE